MEMRNAFFPPFSKSNGRNHCSSKRDTICDSFRIRGLKATVSKIFVVVIDHWQCFVSVTLYMIHTRFIRDIRSTRINCTGANNIETEQRVHLNVQVSTPKQCWIHHLFIPMHFHPFITTSNKLQYYT